MLTQYDKMRFETCSFFKGQRTYTRRPWCYPVKLQWATRAPIATATEQNHSIIFCYFGAVEAKRREQDVVTR